jgi:hypothetical protein
MALLIPLPWSQRPWALAFLTRLAPSERANQRAGKPHRSAIDWTVVMVRVLARWLQRRPWILIGDGAYACVLLGWECLSAQATLISRYLKSQASFSDLLALVRRTIWAEANSVKSTPCGEQVIISRQHWERILTQLASTA